MTLYNKIIIIVYICNTISYSTFNDGTIMNKNCIIIELIMKGFRNGRGLYSVVSSPNLIPKNEEEGLVTF